MHSVHEPNALYDTRLQKQKLQSMPCTSGRMPLSHAPMSIARVFDIDVQKHHRHEPKKRANITNIIPVNQLIGSHSARMQDGDFQSKFVELLLSNPFPKCACSCPHHLQEILCTYFFSILLS